MRPDRFLSDRAQTILLRFREAMCEITKQHVPLDNVAAHVSPEAHYMLCREFGMRSHRASSIFGLPLVVDPALRGQDMRLRYEVVV